ncbi:MAG: VOC family protein [Phycisphaerales bacterium]|nr:MAG: VOC family protein [Phycisphaerales bacterium]
MKKWVMLTLLLVCLAGGLLFAAAGTEKTSDFARTTIDIGIVASDVDKAAQFYKDALGFTEVPGFDVSAKMAGDSGLADYKPFRVRVLVLSEEETATRVKLMEFPDAPGKKVDNRFIHSSLGYSYLTIFVSDMNTAVKRAKDPGVIPVKPPYHLGGNNYLTLLRDPDGNFVELVGPR